MAIGKTNTDTIVTDDQQNIAKTIADLVISLHNPHLITVEDGDIKAPAAMIPWGVDLKDVESLLAPHRPRPKRRRGTASFTDLDSLIAHANRFKGEHSALFAIDDRKAPQLISVINYHQAGFDAQPEFGDHRGHYHFPLSDEWLAWDGKNADAMTQGEFAAFLEDRIGDVLPPPTEAPDKSMAKGNTSPEGERGSKLAELQKLLGGEWAGQSRLLELARSFKVYENSTVKNAINLQTGEVQLQFETEHKDQSGAPLKVPNMFLIGIPVFRLGPVYRMAVRLRYRNQGGKLFWIFQLYRPEAVFDDAFKEGCAYAAKETGLPLFIGKPEFAASQA